MRRRPIPVEMFTSPDGFRYCVYRLFTQEGTLLYVGATLDFRARLDAHGSKTWWRQVDHRQTRTEWYPTAAATEAAENLAIANEFPLHNTRGAAGQSPSRYNPSIVSLEAHELIARMTTDELKASIEQLETQVEANMDPWERKFFANRL